MLFNSFILMLLQLPSLSENDSELSLVRVEGFEPSILSAADFKSAVYTSSTTLASLFYTLFKSAA
jgi:hypothetical protein